MQLSNKRRATHICLLAVLYVAAYLICRYIFDVTGVFPVYTPGWTGRHFLWFAAVVSTLSAFFGWVKFSYITFTGFVLGNIAGELFGGFRSDIPPEFLHYGWLICIIVFFLSCVVGAFIEHRYKNNKNSVRKLNG